MSDLFACDCLTIIKGRATPNSARDTHTSVSPQIGRINEPESMPSGLQKIFIQSAIINSKYYYLVVLKHIIFSAV
jgi:hypothetical protein